MPPTCSASHCSNSYRKGYTLVRFPKDPSRLSKWTAACGHFYPKPSDRICEVHFKPSDWLDYKKLLKYSAVPSLFCIGDGCINSKRGPFRPLNSNRSPSSSSHSPCCSIYVSEDLRLTTVATQSSSITQRTLRCTQLEQENQCLRRNLVTVEKKVSETAKALSKTQEDFVTMEHIATQRKEWLETKFGHDQLQASRSGNSKGRKWSLDSVQKSIEMRLSGGTSGLKTANDVVFPLPGVRTIQRRTQTIKFAPGLLHEFLQPFQECVIPSLPDDFRDCTLHFDEFSTKMQLCYDSGADCLFGNVTFEGVEGLSSKMEVWTFGGTRQRWKLNAAYHCAPQCSCVEARCQTIKDLLQYGERSGLNVLGLVCDMGNRDVLAALGFHTQKNKMTYSIAHPFNSEKKLFLIPDVVHVFKAVKEMLVNNKKICLSAEIVQKCGLSTDTIEIKHLEWLVDFQEDMDVRLAPKLKKKDLATTHFSKMNSASACHIMNHKTAAALQYLADNNVFDRDCKTTAWFVDLMNKWFKILTSRSPVTALDLKNLSAYEEALATLRLVVDVFLTMKVGVDKAVWKPVQTHLVVATEALLEIQDHLLHEKGYQFVFMGRFTNDIAENIFSLVRCQRPTPTALEAKYRLKQITLSQCAHKVAKSQYSHDETVTLLTLDDILSCIKKKLALTAGLQQPTTLLPWSSPTDKNYKFKKEILYRMCGYLLHSLRESSELQCNDCFNILQHQGPEPHPFASWTIQTDYVADAQVQVTDAVFVLLYAIDFNMMLWSKQLAKLSGIKSTVEKSIEGEIEKYCIPSCENCGSIKNRLISRFIEMRLKQMGVRLTESAGKKKEAYMLSSRSMGSRYLAERYVPAKKKPKKTASVERILQFD